MFEREIDIIIKSPFLKSEIKEVFINVLRSGAETNKTSDILEIVKTIKEKQDTLEDNILIIKSRAFDFVINSLDTDYSSKNIYKNLEKIENENDDLDSLTSEF